MVRQINQIRWIRNSLGLGLLVCFWLSSFACGDVPVLPPAKFFCKDDAACGAGYVCHGSVCILAGRLEGNSNQESTTDTGLEPTAEIANDADEQSTPEEVVTTESTEPNPQEFSPEENIPTEPITEPITEPTTEPISEPITEPTPEDAGPSEPSPEVISEEVAPEPNQEAQPEGCSGPTGQTCCASKADCARGHYCALNGFCYPDNQCVHPDRFTCPTLGDICKNDGKCGDCKTDAECGTDAKCSLQGRCFHYPCTKDSDCPTNMACQDLGLGLRCVVPLKTNTNGYVVGWQDDSFAKDCMDYRYPPVGYAAVTRNGVYQILDKADKHWVSCNMTYAGGGWTLTMKIQKSGSTFGYGSPRWEDDMLVGATTNPTDVVLDGNDAKLLSYIRVKVKQIMLQMQTDPDVSIITPAKPTEQRRAILTLDVQENSLKDAIKGAKALATAGGLERQNWRAMAYNAPAFPNVCKEGLKIEQAVATKKIGVRIGVITTSAAASCMGEPAWIGVGGQFLDANNAEQTLGAGSWRKGALSSQNDALYAYVWVRAFPAATQPTAQQNINGQTARAYSTSSFAESCLAYRMPPSISEVSGDYWLKDGTTSTPYRAYCNMARHGGGWTLALKVEGDASQKTFTFDPSSAWENGVLSQNMNQGHNPTTKGSFSLKSYTMLAPQQMMLEQFISQVASSDPASSTNSSPTSLVVHLTNPNDAPLAKVFAASNPAAIRFAYPLGAMAWMEWFPNPTAKLHTGCVSEGFSIEQTFASDSSKYAKVRIGALGQAELCSSTNQATLSWIGLGGTGTTCNLNNNWVAGASSGDCGSFAGGKLDIASQMNLYLR